MCVRVCVGMKGGCSAWERESKLAKGQRENNHQGRESQMKGERRRQMRATTHQTCWRFCEKQVLYVCACGNERREQSMGPGLIVSLLSS